MRAALEDDNVRIRYLLGESSEEEQQEFERAYLEESSSFEELLAFEDELIDAYVGNRLSPAESKRFEARFLGKPQWRERVEFAKALRRLALETSAWETPRFWPLPIKKARASFLLAATLVVALGGSWLVFRYVGARKEIGELRLERAALERRVGELQREVTEERSRLDQVLAKIDRDKNRQPIQAERLAPPAQPRTVSFVLTAGLVRNTGESRKLLIPKGTDRVRLVLSLSRDEYTSYRAVLETSEGRELWRQDSLRTRGTPRPKGVSLDVPARLLEPDDYVILLQGSLGKGDFEEVNEYSFRVLQQ